MDLQAHLWLAETSDIKPIYAEDDNDIKVM